MRRIYIATKVDRSSEFVMEQGSFVWPNDMTWKEFLSRHDQFIPVNRIVWSKRRQYKTEMQTSMIL
jgi:hypothetical protein